MTEERAYDKVVRPLPGQKDGIEDNPSKRRAGWQYDLWIFGCQD